MGALLVVQIWNLLHDILLGLQHLHHQGILHRDLKPTNILLQGPEDTGGRLGEETVRNSASGVLHALLSDFGTATALGEPPASSSARGYTGTVEYTAPELLRSQGDPREQYTEKSDMWSLGIVLYAMCFSTLPFSNDDPHLLKEQIRRFVEERQQGSVQGPLVGGADTTEAQAAWLPPDTNGRLGRLRLVLAALLAFDAGRRPAATDLLENPTFRRQIVRYVRRTGDHAALPDS